MSATITKTAVWGYAVVGTDHAWLGIGRDDSGEYSIINEHKVIQRTLPTSWRTQDDIVATARSADYEGNFSMLPVEAIGAHKNERHGRKRSQQFKTARTLSQFVMHMTKDATLTKTIVTSLQAAYAA